MRAGDGTGGNRRPRRRGSHLGAYISYRGQLRPRRQRSQHRGRLRPRRRKSHAGDNYARTSRGPCVTSMRGKMQGQCKKVWLAPTLCSAGAPSLCSAGVRTLVSDHPAIRVRSRYPLGHPACPSQRSGNSRRYWAGAASLDATRPLPRSCAASRAPPPTPAAPPRPQPTLLPWGVCRRPSRVARHHPDLRSAQRCRSCQ